VNTPSPTGRAAFSIRFAREALAAIQKDPNQAFVKTEGSGSKTVVRVAIADRLVNQACVNCHNRPPGHSENQLAAGRCARSPGGDHGAGLSAGDESEHADHGGSDLPARGGDNQWIHRPVCAIGGQGHSRG